MAVAATVAVALAAWLGSVATGGVALGDGVIPPGVYGLGLVAAVAGVAAGRRPAPPALPAGLVTAGKIALAMLGLYLFAGRGQATGISGLMAAAALAAVAVAWWWPHPAALRLSLAFAVAGLLGPAQGGPWRPAALVAMAGAVAVGLVLTSRLGAAALPALGGSGLPPRPRARTARETAVVGLVLVAAALVAQVYQPPSQSEPRRQPPVEAGATPELQDGPGPLGFEPGLEPAAAGPGRGGDKVVLRVDADRPDVWRAQVFDRWDGRRWSPAPSFTRAEGGRRPVFVVLDPFEAAPLQPLLQQVRIEASYAAVAVGAPKAYVFDLPGPATVSLDGTVRLTPPLGRGSTYLVTSNRHPASADRLRAGDPDPAVAGPERLAAPGLSARSRALALRVTAGAPTAYDKVRALEAELARRVRVDDDVAPVPAGADVVDRVLFEDRAGSPARLATTLAVLTRAVGVPARVAIGFLPGQRSFLGGDFVVRARDAHVWVEVPFPGLGWHRFDATGRIAEAERQDSLWARLLRFLRQWWPVVVAGLLLVVALVLGRLVRRHRARAALPWAARYLARLDKVGAKRGRARRPAETPAEYASALAGGELADERLHHVGRLVTEAAWSGRQPTDEARRWAEEVLREVSARRRR